MVRQEIYGYPPRVVKRARHNSYRVNDPATTAAAATALATISLVNHRSLILAA
jgi:hypothetical protein